MRFIPGSVWLTRELACHRSARNCPETWDYARIRLDFIRRLTGLCSDEYLDRVWRTGVTRSEYVVIYRTDLQVAPQLVVNDEALAFLWWDRQSSANEQMNPIDAEIARRTIRPQSRGDPEQQKPTPVPGADALTCR